MKRIKFSPSKIAAILKEFDAGKKALKFLPQKKEGAHPSNPLSNSKNYSEK